MQIGTLLVGIEDYIEPRYRQSQFRLHYATEDVNAFVRYLSGAWQDHILHIRCLPNEKATQKEILAAAASLAHQSIDILFVYLSGHGDKDIQGNGWFCLVDAVPGKPSLDGISLDHVLSTIGARTTLLLLDCCYAESVVSSSRFFNTLQNAHARLFLCSSRADQQTWEDNAVKHGIFSNILLRGLSTASALANPTGLVDVETALFPYLCEQVPLAVVAAKGQGQRQEPVKGGISSGPVLIPTVTASLLGRQLSTYDAIRLGTRRWLTRTAAAVVLVFITIQLAFYHLAIGPTGELEVRAGLKATEAFAFFGTPVETGITQAFLVTDAEDPAGHLRPQLVDLAERKIWGISPHRQVNNLKGWLDQLLPILRRGYRAELIVLATGRLPPDYLVADPERESPPFRTILEAALLTSDAPPDKSTPFHFDYDLPSAADLDCANTVANIRDFSLTEPASSVLAADLSWIGARALFQPEAAIHQGLEAAKVVAYRISQADQRPKNYSASHEAKVLAAMLLSISKTANESRAQGSSLFSTPPASWCEPGFAIARLFLGEQEDSRKAASTLGRLVGAVADIVNDNIAQARSDAALAGLQVFGISREIPAETIDAIVHIVQQNAQGLDGEPDISEWLRTIAPHQIIPPGGIDWLFSQLSQSPENFSSSPLMAFNILARTSSHLEGNKQRTLAAWYAEHFAEYKTQSLFAEAAGYLGAVVSLTPAAASFLGERLVPEIYISECTRTRRGALLIRSSDFNAGIGLGVMAKTQKLQGDIVSKLYSFAAARRKLGDLHDVYEGLAIQRSDTTEDLPGSVIANLGGTRSSRIKRQVEIEIAIAQILNREPEDRKRLIRALRQSWSEESEPELRMALAQVIVGSKLRIANILLPVDSVDSCDSEN